MAILAAVSSVILIGGWWARPRDVPQAPAPVPSETELEQLSRRAERRTLESMNQFFAGVAREVGSSIAYVHGSGASGIAWDSTRVVTAFRPRGWSAGPVSLAAAGDIQAEPAVWGPNLPLAALTITHDAAPLVPARRSRLMPSTGDWLVAVWRTGTAPAYGVGNFRQALSITCGDIPVQELGSSLSLTSTMTGGGLFDLDGGLLAVILPCQERLVAVAATSIESILQRPTSPAQQLEARYGLTVGSMSPDEQEYFKTHAGLLVRTVWIGYAAETAGIRPGDVVTAVNGQPAVAVPDLTALMMATGALEVTVQRGRKRLAITLATSSDASASVESSGAGVVLEKGAPITYRIESVRPDGRAARAGIQSGDRLVRIDQAELRGSAQVERMLDDGQRSVWLELVRDGRQLGVLLR